jgi:integral membrane protein (TIGR00529 family)
MLDLLKIALIFGLILLLLRKKVAIGHVMLISSGALFLLYAMNPLQILTAARKAFISSITIKLLLSLSLIKVFELVLREQNVLSSMMSTVKETFVSRKAVMISMPLLIGMLPSLGGAYFSAPMVGEATEDQEMGQDEKAFINYWFRHPWEFMLPLYPGILFASVVSGIPLSSLVMANIIYALTMIITGFIFSMRRVNSPAPAEKRSVPHAGAKQWLNFLPIAAVLGLVLILKIELHSALIIILIPLFIFYRYGAIKIIRSLKHGFSMNLIIMIAGIVLFKEMMEASGAVANLSRFFVENGIPSVPVFCLLPFIAGLLTGHTVGFVGSSFPLLLSIVDHVSLSLISLAFVSGLIGVLLSPVHLCLILSREYFRADLSGIYRKTIPAGAIVFGVAVIRYLIAR